MYDNRQRKEQVGAADWGFVAFVITSPPSL
jgi:hypothetical protein